MHQTSRSHLYLIEINLEKKEEEMAALRKQIGQLERELVAKEARIQGLGGELVTFKEIIGEFEEQKGLVKAKVEQQQEQFRQLEEQFERRLREREEEGVQAMAQQKRMYEEEVSSYLLLYGLNKQYQIRKSVIPHQGISDINEADI